MKRIVVKRTNNNNNNNYNSEKALRDIESELGISFDLIHPTLASQIIETYIAKKRAESTLEMLVEHAKYDSDCQSDYQYKKECERTVSMLLIPMIDPHYKERSEQVQQEIYDLIFDFYIMVTNIPNINVTAALKDLETSINKVILSENE